MEEDAGFGGGVWGSLFWGEGGVEEVGEGGEVQGEWVVEVVAIG
ncbi:hypothetical protein UO65_3436 [Actinokineospora spheciospongiae]|uniref:Uncharacterized protein n=1 Tax=Actinokineospora spheciospongiae TaxID=909613 RepID=W7J573_9PSEU|nr:hypothetical protein UO65_3436 [Actinokineospora spheciospongiae]